MRFIAFLFLKDLAANTISTYVAALASINRMYAGEDILGAFLIKKLLIGIHKIRGVPDQRLPIHIDLLHKLVDSLMYITHDAYVQSLLKAMYLVAFHAFLRIGEITTRSQHNKPNVLQYVDVVIRRNVCVLILRGTKTSDANKPVLIKIEESKNIHYCPVRALSAFFSLRGKHLGPFFTFENQCPITRSAFSFFLSKSVAWAGMNPMRYKTHSFRIGAATTAAMRGFNDVTIQRLGRWKSNAFKKYIRICM